MSWCNTKPPWTTIRWYQVAPPQLQVPTPAWSFLLPLTFSDPKLLELKHRIEVLDASGEWEYLKRCSNPYESVFAQSQDTRVLPSVCTLRPLSRSFFKMIEILSALDFFRRHGNITSSGQKRKHSIRTAHVCEGPGGFIEAILHQSHRVGWNVDTAWAMTLKPTRPNIPGWKRAYTFLRKSPMVRIEYGADDTGDIMIPANQQQFLSHTAGACHIFTADGGFDFSESYEKQEEEVFPLLVSSALIGLQTLVKGGDFVLKIFDTDLKSTQDLIILLASCFDSWTLYKPAMSRPCNAEKYFLGKGCRAIPKGVISTLASIRDTYAAGDFDGLGARRLVGIFPVVPKVIADPLVAFQREFLQHQLDALEFAFENKESWNMNPKEIWSKIHTQSVAWCKQFQMPLKAFSGVGL